MDNHSHRHYCAVCASRHNSSPTRRSPTRSLLLSQISSPANNHQHHDHNTHSTTPPVPPPSIPLPVSPSLNTSSISVATTDNNNASMINPPFPPVPTSSTSITEERITTLEQQIQFLLKENQQQKIDNQNLLTLIQDLVHHQQIIKDENKRLYHHLETIFYEIERNAKEPIPIIPPTNTITSLPSAPVPRQPSVSATANINTRSQSITGSTDDTSMVSPVSPYAMKALAQETARLRSLAALHTSSSSSSSNSSPIISSPLTSTTTTTIRLPLK